MRATRSSPARADVEAIIARQGFIVADHPALKSLYSMRMRRGLPISTLIDDLHGRHHLLARDLPALLVLLTLDTGLEPECLKALTTDCLTNPHAGTVELRYLKRRAAAPSTRACGCAMAVAAHRAA
jgi:hypothetical protein